MYNFQASVVTIRTSPVVKRHRQDGVRRLCAHPHLPLYVSGGQDGAVLLWEWSHSQQVNFLFSGLRIRILLKRFANQIWNRGKWP